MSSQKTYWNWQKSQWPNFTWDVEKLKEAEAQFLHRAGLFQGALRHMGEDDKAALTIEVISTEAYKTSEIEGEFLDRESLQSSLRNNFGLSGDTRRIPPAEKGIADMMTALYRGYDRSLDNATLFDWHRMVMSARRDVTDVGCYRRVSKMAVRSGSEFEVCPSVSAIFPN